MELSCPLRTIHHVLQENFSQKPYDKSFIYQACSFKTAGYWLRSFFVRLWTETESGQYPAILMSHLVNNPYMMWVRWLIAKVTLRRSVTNLNIPLKLTTMLLVRIVSTIVVMITLPVRWDASAVGTSELIRVTCSS